MERAQKKVEGRNFDIRKTLIKFDDVMNDQRKVIFSQRLKILKSNDITSIVTDFFDEIMEILIKSKINYEKSNDEKVFITSVKNLIGNALSDQALIELAKDDLKKFHKQN